MANAPAHVAAFFRRIGLREVPIPSVGSWWADSQGRVGPWEDHLPRVAVELNRLRMFAAAAPRPFYRTSEFWMTVAGVAGAATTATAALAGISDLPAPWDKAFGLLATAMGATMPLLYRYARARAKEESDREQTRLMHEAQHGQPSIGPSGSGGAGYEGGVNPGKLGGEIP